MRAIVYAPLARPSPLNVSPSRTSNACPQATHMTEIPWERGLCMQISISQDSRWRDMEIVWKCTTSRKPHTISSPAQLVLDDRPVILRSILAPTDSEKTGDATITVSLRH
ncbi:hypothetical protein QCA50_016393 [Cerrena zonata]|uniref:Uncharacterized protein n=1 Tax=Cerrena zonata TaxID=2478898 RepID=A0AAW0FTA7_9APHY